MFTISGQGHTFGSVLQDVCMRDRKELGIRSVGYFETHPLEDRIVVRVDMPETVDVESCDHDTIISKMRAHCVRELERFRSAHGRI
jgi:DNA-directed RNA polymerase subunit L